MQIIKVQETEKHSIRRLFDVIGNNKYFLILLCCLVVGMLFGALSVKGTNPEESDILYNWFRSFIEARTNSGLWQIFFKSFLTAFLYLLVLTVSAFGVSGIPIFPAVMLFRGFGTCMLSGFLYRDCSLEGIAFADLILLPSSVVLDFVLVYYSSKAMELSVNFFSVFKGSVQNVQLLKTVALSLLKKCLICVCTVAVSSFADAVFTVCFSKYFNLM